MRARAAWLFVAITACGGNGEPSDGGTSTGSTTTETTTSSSTSGSSSSESEGGFIDTSSSSGADSGTTGPACSERDMCMSLGDCELGECVDCMCVFDYGPCAGGECTCFVPSVAVCIEGGCFCTLPCNVGEPDPCPTTPSGTSAPVCA
ncbi:MAG TPA: hypothetical protein VG755_00670, partial [Nannocystaceae bacterium]|nr:hypothetical protein [Nannocystaceae bacterium]